MMAMRSAPITLLLSRIYAHLFVEVIGCRNQCADSSSREQATL
jgi:hypothetical protein